MVAVVENLKEATGETYGRICRELDAAYSSLMRWKSRLMNGEKPVRAPGPCKVGPLDAGNLCAEIRTLSHGRQRTCGTGQLYRKWNERVSRRALNELVEATRRELRQEESELERHVEWLVPGLVWSMDDSKDHWLPADRFGHIHLVKDLASRYILRSLGQEVMAKGELVAENIEELICINGAPLFFKRDNGTNLNHHAVNEMMGRFLVIPLNSPRYYPPYNGGVERGHQELARHLRLRIGNDVLTAREFRLECEVSGHEINHKRRRSLGGQTACQALASGRPWVRLFGRRERKEAYEEIMMLAVDIAAELGEHTEKAAETAFRHAAETWMQLNQLIRVTRNGKVLPCFFQI